METKKAKCGRCFGSGYVTQSDGVGGKWQERCLGCNAAGEVLIVVEAPTPPLVPAMCLLCGRTLIRPDGSPSFCDDTHELVWWRSRGQLATITKRGPG